MFNLTRAKSPVCLPPPIFLIRLQPFQIALQTQSVMATDPIPAFSALPFLFFFDEKNPDALFFDSGEIVDHAEVILRTIAEIERLQAVAGKIVALKTVSYLAFPQQVAVLFHEGAVLSPDDAPRTIGLVESFRIDFVFHGEITDTEAAVHTARGDERFIHRFTLSVVVSTIHDFTHILHPSIHFSIETCLIGFPFTVETRKTSG